MIVPNEIGNGTIFVKTNRLLKDALRSGSGLTLNLFLDYWWFPWSFFPLHLFLYFQNKDKSYMGTFLHFYPHFWSKFHCEVVFQLHDHELHNHDVYLYFVYHHCKMVSTKSWRNGMVLSILRICHTEFWNVCLLLAKRSESQCLEFISKTQTGQSN